MEILALSDPHVKERAVQVLGAGGIVIFPTETCYGLGVDATNTEAVSKLLAFKAKREGKAISVVMADQEMAERYVELNETARHLYKTFLPGPVTVISRVRNSKSEIRNAKQMSKLQVTNHKQEIAGHSHEVVNPDRSSKAVSSQEAGDSSDGVPDRNRPNNMEGSSFRDHNVNMVDSRVVSEMGTLGVRIPDYGLAIEIVRKLGRPMTATSANVSYNPNPYSLEQWEKQTPEKSRGLVDLWIDAGPLPQRPSSTVVDTTKDELTVVRQGAIQLSGDVKEYVTSSEEETKRLAAEIISKLQITISNKGLVIGLQGELGAGKTRFAKGVAGALGVNEEVQSPTFTLVEEYLINLKISLNLDGIPDRNRPNDMGGSSFRDDKGGMFYHIDAWRMEREEELVEVGFEEMLQAGNVVVIEWVEKVSEVVKKMCEEKGVEILWGAVTEIEDGERKWRFGKAK